MIYSHKQCGCSKVKFSLSTEINALSALPTQYICRNSIQAIDAYCHVQEHHKSRRILIIILHKLKLILTFQIGMLRYVGIIVLYKRTVGTLKG